MLDHDTVRRCAGAAAGLACEDSGLPSYLPAAGGRALPSLGAVLNEAAHTAALGVAIGLTAPRLGALAIGAAVVAVLRSPFAATGPALNLAVRRRRPLRAPARHRTRRRSRAGAGRKGPGAMRRMACRRRSESVRTPGNLTGATGLLWAAVWAAVHLCLRLLLYLV